MLLEAPCITCQLSNSIFVLDLVVGLVVSFSEAGKPLSTLVLFGSNLVSLNPPCCRAAFVWKADSNASLGETLSECVVHVKICFDGFIGKRKIRDVDFSSFL